MRTPIFRSASYLLVVGINDPALQTAILEQCREHRLRTYFCQGLQELKVVIETMSRITALFVFAENIPTASVSESIDSFLKKQIPVRVFGSNPELQSLSNASCKISAYTETSYIIDDLVLMMVPPGLEKVLLEGAYTILPHFLEKIPPLKAIKSAGFGFDRQLNFSLVAGNVVGLGIFRVKLASIESLLPKSKHATGLEHFQEAMNQWIGSIAARMSIVGMGATVGLPTWFDISSIPELQTLIFFPSAHITDDKNQFAVSIGFVDITGARLNFDGIENAATSDEVEFL